MLITQEKTDLAAFMHAHISGLFGSDPEEDSRKTADFIDVLSGVYVESCFLFAQPDETLTAGFTKLQQNLRLAVEPVSVPVWALSPPQRLDLRSEQGRTMARFIVEEWQECEYAFFEFVLWLIQSYVTAWEGEGIPREETFRLFSESATRCMAFEIAAQELCDLVIERRIGTGDWSLADAVAGLSAYSGYCFALYEQDNPALTPFDRHIDTIVHVMTQEASRMGVPAGSDWKLGLAANDCPADPPIDLVESIHPLCNAFFRALSLLQEDERAVCCAKAAGRMLAVVATGDTPDMPHAIAKPLAMAALMETYRGLQVLTPEIFAGQDAELPAE